MMRRKVKHGFWKFKTIRFLGKEIYSSIITLNYALEEQLNLKDQFDEFEESAKPK